LNGDEGFEYKKSLMKEEKKMKKTENYPWIIPLSGSIVIYLFCKFICGFEMDMNTPF